MEVGDIVVRPQLFNCRHRDIAKRMAAIHEDLCDTVFAAERDQRSDWQK